MLSVYIFFGVFVCGAVVVVVVVGVVVRRIFHFITRYRYKKRCSISIEGIALSVTECDHYD